MCKMCAFAHNIQTTVQNVISVYACMSSMSMYVFYCPVYVLDVFASVHLCGLNLYTLLLNCHIITYKIISVK